MLKIKDLSISLGEFSMQNINLHIKRGEYFILLGHSGAGKSVLLENIAGLVKQQSGTLALNGEDITKRKIQDRKVGLVFQDFALFPHMSVFQNIAYPLKIQKLNKDTINKKVNELGQLMNIDCLFDRMPETLSGGEKQRVALARTLTLEPDVLLLDEPLSAIDVSLKGELRSLLRKLNNQGQTIMHVTHDYEEAISLAHRLGIVHEGEIIQTGSPHEVFKHPKNKFVAHFSGIKNFYEAELGFNPSMQTVMAHVAPNLSFKIHTKIKAKRGCVLIGQKNILVSRNSHKQIEINEFKGVVKEVIPARFGVELVIDAGVLFYVASSNELTNSENYKQGDTVWVAFNPSAVRFIPG